MSEHETYDAIVIGSGFAGAVTACRLAEADLTTCILERGRRFNPKDDFPVYPSPTDPNVPSDAPKDGRDTLQPDVTRFFWRPGHGVWDLRDLGDVVVGQAAGFGGGSLIYANVHLRPPKHIFDERWPIDRSTLDPYYDLAAQMLQVAPLPDIYKRLPKKVQLERAANDLRRIQFGDDPIDPTRQAYLRPFAPPLAVNFPTNGERGPGVCDLRGDCCLGCPQHAKRTLDLNYLKQAEGANTPAEVRTLAEVVWIEGLKDGTFKVEYRNHLAGKALESVYGSNVFLCAGAVNTTELLLRCREAKKLSSLPSTGLGTCFHPNQDALAAVFECDEPQELDRGPTISTSLVYDREPGNKEPSARWRLGFTGAKFEPEPGSEIGSTSGGTARVATPACVISGSYGGEDGKSIAIGDLILAKLKGVFAPGDDLTISDETWGRVGTEPSKLRHWFLIQDGGFPVAFEPALGVFRSPLWLGRNAFREEQRLRCDGHESAEHAAGNQRIGYATLPVEALTDLLSGVTRGAPGFNVTEVGESALQLARDSDRGRDGEGDKGRWSVLPTQLDGAIRKFRTRALDAVGLAAEDVVSEFLDDAADSISDKLDAGLAAIAGEGDDKDDENNVKELGLARRTFRRVVQRVCPTEKPEGKDTDDEIGIKELELARGALRLGVQLLWGSQSGLARAIAEQLVEKKFAGRGQLVEAGVDLLRHVLDYRLGNGRSAMLLSMGLDSTPGTLALELPASPKVGTEVRGGESRARAVLLATRLNPDTSFGDETAKGRVIIAGVTDAFKNGELLFAGPTKLGKLYKQGLLHSLPPSMEPDSTDDCTDLALQVLHFKPDAATRSLPLASTAPLQARLPDSVDTPERGAQERILRDIASAWGGELRTDPLWTFLDRRFTVHPQGGCPMGPRRKGGVVDGVTDEAGKVRGYDGLYVMDAAAFPGPVGANPSATIAAVAEYKVAKFLESLPGRGAAEAAKLKAKRTKATDWVNRIGREKLDPLGPSGRAAPGPNSAEPAHRPVGIQFEERMVGSEHGARAVEMELTARIDDLATFLGRHARRSTERIRIVTGVLKVDGKEVPIDPTKSSMIVMARPDIDEGDGPVRTIKYRLVTQGHQFELDGIKIIRDDPGFDAWEDTTKLGFALTEGAKTRQGELRLSAADFFQRQLPSFRVNTDDPARQAWALASFGKFFLGNLAAVYVPGLDQLGELGASLMGRGHG